MKSVKSSIDDLAWQEVEEKLWAKVNSRVWTLVQTSVWIKAENVVQQISAQVENKVLDEELS